MKAWNDSVKKSIRPSILRNRRQSPAKRALFMPAHTAFCVKEALRQRTIDQDTKLVIVDRDSATLRAGGEKCERMGFNFVQPYCGDIKDFLYRADDLFTNREGQFDFAYLDTCSEMTGSFYQSLRQFFRGGNFCRNENSSFAYTFTTACRSIHPIDDFFRWCAKGMAPFARHGNSSRPQFSNNMRREAICQAITNTVKKAIATDGQRLSFTSAYKEQGSGYPMMTGRIQFLDWWRGGSVHCKSFLDAGYA